VAVRKKLARKTASPRSAPKTASRGADVAQRYIADQAPDKRELLEKLRALVVKVVPDATVAMKWGVPVYARNGKNICAIAGFKEHVAITFFAPRAALSDPGGRLEGGGKVMTSLKVRTARDIDSASIQRWLNATVAARG
jgi:hypothetical protein